MLKYMLDTDIAIHTIKNRPSEVRAAFKATMVRYISSLTLMELIYGAEASPAVDRSIQPLKPGPALTERASPDSHIGIT